MGRRLRKKAAFFGNAGRLGFVGAVCGKRNYGTHAAARAAVKALLHSGRDREAGSGKVLDSYWCERCSAWHIGNSMPWQDPRPERIAPA